MSGSVNKFYTLLLISLLSGDSFCFKQLQRYRLQDDGIINFKEVSNIQNKAGKIHCKPLYIQHMVLLSTEIKVG